jgi:hypothetical protein
MPAFLHAINPLYSLSGLVVGALVGFTGVGGGSLMTPLLVLVFGIHPATAVGTDLLYAGLTKIGGTAVHAYNRAVDWRIVRQARRRQRPRRGADPPPAQPFRQGQSVGRRDHHLGARLRPDPDRRDAAVSPLAAQEAR